MHTGRTPCERFEQWKCAINKRSLRSAAFDGALEPEIYKQLDEIVIERVPCPPEWNDDDWKEVQEVVFARELAVLVIAAARKYNLSYARSLARGKVVTVQSKESACRVC